MKSTPVFVDTNIFRHYAYNFKTPEIQKLTEIIKSDSVDLVIHRVVDLEIQRHLNEEKEKSLATIQKALKAIKDWIGKSHADLISQNTSKRINYSFSKLTKQYEAFLKFAKIAEIKVEDCETVMRLWSKRDMGFSQQEEKKFFSNFKDRLIAASVIRHAEISSMSSPILVTSDLGLIDWIQKKSTRVVIYKNLPDYLESYFKNLSKPEVFNQLKKEISHLVDSTLAKNGNILWKKIGLALKDTWIEFEDSETEGEVFSHELKNISLVDCKVISNEANKVIDFQITVDVELECYVGFGETVDFDQSDPNIVEYGWSKDGNWISNHELKVYGRFNKKTKKVQFSSVDLGSIFIPVEVDQHWYLK